MRVEELDGRIEAVGCDGGDVVVPDVEESDEDEYVRQQCCRPKPGYVTDQSQWYEHNKLNCYECHSADRHRRAWRDGVEERAKIFRNENDARTDESYLR